jgi:flagellar basal body P-ring formation protein FlgA
MFRFLVTLVWALSALSCRAQVLPSAWLDQVERLAETAAQAVLPPQGRVDIVMGQPDPRLRLAPCTQVQPFLPPGTPLWGRSRIGLRCLQGPVKWSISVPVQVRVFATAWAAANPLPAGTVLAAEHLSRQVVELSADPSPAFAQEQAPLGRQLQRPLQAGEALRQAQLKPRQWFAAGEAVRVLLTGDGFAIRAEGQALSAGLEGQPTRVRLEGGRVLAAWPVAERQAEVQL